MKSHFQFSNQERNGIFLLLAVIVSAQCFYWFSDDADPPLIEDLEEIHSFRKELDSLRIVEIEKGQPQIYPFNPNFITDYKGYTLGMSNEEIDRLHNYRERDQWINSKEQFKTVTGISDSLLDKISPYFKFPSWVNKPRQKNQSAPNSYTSFDKPKTFDQKIDLNKATALQLQKVYGVGEKLSQRIMNYRDKFADGFHDDIELTEVYGLTTEVIERIKQEFTVKTPRPIKKLNLNTATRDELVTIKYIDYEIANSIIEERTLREGFKSFEELTKVEQFPVKKLEIIKLYLHL
ncbi:ComEA family DNA-binding protein [Winogradskyella aurantia]|uniref:Competence protein ComEA n=1 Tax=Winogradskyella aurantia TaxID=1915063 RepID=A0A265UUL2_9FLAO|nr:helix-hairpin-helix domain-containing protein [Winogradskyella aurantia]OZV68998.1 competence protein ComEA [Winogradskyella aurantia]